MRAVTPGDEEQCRALLRVQCRMYGGAAGQRDRRGRQAVARVGVVGGVGTQMGTGKVAVELGAYAVDDGRIRLQPHAALQAANEHAGDGRPLAGGAGFLLDDGGKHQRLLRRFQRQVRRSRLPFLFQHLLHLGMGATQKRDIRGRRREMIGIRQEAALRVLARGADELHQLLVRDVVQRVLDPFVGAQCHAQLGKGPALDDGERPLHDTAGHQQVDDRRRGHAGLEKELAGLELMGLAAQPRRPDEQVVLADQTLFAQTECNLRHAGAGGDVQFARGVTDGERRFHEGAVLEREPADDEASRQYERPAQLEEKAAHR